MIQRMLECIYIDTCAKTARQRLGLRWLAGNGADTAFARKQALDVGCSCWMFDVSPFAKRCVPLTTHPPQSKTLARILDKFGLKAKVHTQAAKFLRDKHGLSDWWAQAVTIRYEWEKGLRGKKISLMRPSLTVGRTATTFPNDAKQHYDRSHRLGVSCQSGAHRCAEPGALRRLFRAGRDSLPLRSP